MNELLSPLKAESLSDVFVSRFEELILSGRLQIGQKLPSERELALQLGVSRPVVHEGLMELAYRGLVTMKPRAGAVVNDYRREGSLALLTSLLNYQQGEVEGKLLLDILDIRRLFETETARLAALNASKEQLGEFARHLALEQEADPEDAEGVAGLDFEFHHMVSLAAGNAVYPLILNSFKPLFTNLSGQFFADPGVVSVVFGFHRELVQAFKKKDERRAASVMEKLLEHGKQRMIAISGNGKGNQL